MTGDDSSKLIGFDGQPLFWPSTISNTQCQFSQTCLFEWTILEKNEWKRSVIMFVCLKEQLQRTGLEIVPDILEV